MTGRTQADDYLVPLWKGQAPMTTEQIARSALRTFDATRNGINKLAALGFVENVSSARPAKWALTQAGQERCNNLFCWKVKP